jgi:lipopolysaccharide biosynthesis glycosyltransferase
MGFALTLDEYLCAVAKETARMSGLGHMALILKAGANKDAETYFTSGFLVHN